MIADGWVELETGKTSRWSFEPLFSIILGGTCLFACLPVGRQDIVRGR